jgi:hypothetical protein
MRGTRTTESSTSQRRPKLDRKLYHLPSTSAMTRKVCPQSAVTAWYHDPACGLSKTDEIPADISPTAFGMGSDTFSRSTIFVHRFAKYIERQFDLHGPLSFSPTSSVDFNLSFK